MPLAQSGSRGQESGRSRQDRHLALHVQARCPPGKPDSPRELTQWKLGTRSCLCGRLAPAGPFPRAGAGAGLSRPRAGAAWEWVPRAAGRSRGCLPARERGLPTFFGSEGGRRRAEQTRRPGHCPQRGHFCQAGLGCYSEEGKESLSSPRSAPPGPPARPATPGQNKSALVRGSCPVFPRSLRPQPELPRAGRPRPGPVAPAPSSSSPFDHGGCTPRSDPRVTAPATSCTPPPFSFNNSKGNNFSDANEQPLHFPRDSYFAAAVPCGGGGGCGCRGGS